MTARRSISCGLLARDLKLIVIAVIVITVYSYLIPFCRAQLSRKVGQIQLDLIPLGSSRVGPLEERVVGEFQLGVLGVVVIGNHLKVDLEVDRLGS